MRYAATGVNLEVNLSRGGIESVKTDPEFTRLYLGGLGANAKILWDRVPPETEPFSEKNLLIFSPGLLVGTPAPSANRTVISSISPQTKFFAFSMMGGIFGAAVKFAGYDSLIFSGKSADWVYLWIDGTKAEIRDASHLVGKGTYQTMEFLRAELGDIAVACIGLAGENRVYFASVEADRGGAGRLGLGAIMGDKKLKAVAVKWGSGDIHIARPVEFKELCDEVIKYTMHRLRNPLPDYIEPPYFRYVGTPGMYEGGRAWHLNHFAWGNARMKRKDFWRPELDDEFKATLDATVKRWIHCHNCPFTTHCGGIIEVPGEGIYPMKCFTKITYLLGAMVDSLEFDLRIAARALSHGFDSISCPQVMAFAIELYENGILTESDMPGFPPTPMERFYWLLEKIAHREGIGDVLADGVYWAARRIGRGAEAFDTNTIRKHEQVPIKLGMLNPLYFLLYSTNEKSTIIQIEGQYPQAPLPDREAKEEFIKDWIQIPTGKEEKFKKFILEWGEGDNKFPFWPSIDVICDLAEWPELLHSIDDSLGLCAGFSSFAYKPPYHVHNLPAIVASAAGFDMDEQELWKTAKRIRTLIRAVSVRRGLRKDDDRPPESHWKKRFPELEAQLLDAYYKLKGWNKESIPTKQTLQELDLGYVAEDFEQRGILKDGPD
jgi:benzoyl-CoA reductase subunit BamB